MCTALDIDEDTVADLSRPAHSDRFTPLEKAVLDLAVAMTSTPADVSAELRHRARLNRALGVRAMGFATDGFCLLPERPTSRPERAEP